MLRDIHNERRYVNSKKLTEEKEKVEQTNARLVGNIHAKTPGTSSASPRVTRKTTNSLQTKQKDKLTLRNGPILSLSASVRGPPAQMALFRKFYPCPPQSPLPLPLRTPSYRCLYSPNLTTTLYTGLGRFRS